LAFPQRSPGTGTRPSDDARSADAKVEPARILIVEDDYLIAMQTEAALTAAGFNVVGTATTAEEAVALAGDERPFLAVMDIRLASRRDGIDAARELFHDLGIRCIFATAHDAPLGWLAKPYTMSTLVVLVTEALAKLARGGPLA
jgi:CheY-like chemotaxis protein